MDVAAPHLTGDRVVYSVSEIASLLGVSRTTVYAMIHDRELPTVKIAGALRVTRDDLYAYIDQRRVED